MLFLLGVASLTDALSKRKGGSCLKRLGLRNCQLSVKMEDSLRRFVALTLHVGELVI